MAPVADLRGWQQAVQRVIGDPEKTGIMANQAMAARFLLTMNDYPPSQTAARSTSARSKIH